MNIKRAEGNAVVSREIKHESSQRGVAMILALLAMLMMSVMAASVMFTSQAQTWTSINYQLAAQSRYAAEAGVQRTMNWLQNSYTAPTSFGSYTTTTNPVQYSGANVVLSGVSGISSNYPDATVASAYNTALSNQALSSSPPTGEPNATFSTYATLLRMTPGGGVSWLGGSSAVVQTWQITSIGSVTGARSATVQVVATYERTSTPIFGYAVATSSTACKSLDFGGTDGTDSYNSSSGAYGGTNVQTSGGNIASNGNITLGSGTNIQGTISAPNTTVGACPDGITNGTGKTTFDLGTTTMSKSLSFQLPWGCTTTPCYPNPLPPTTAQNVSTSCASITGCTSNGTTVIYDNNKSTTANAFTLTPGSYGNLTIDNADVVHLTAGTYNVNSLNFAKDGQLVIDSGPVVFNVAGQGYASGSTVVNSGGLSGWNLCNGGAGNPGAYGVASCGGASKTALSGVPSNFQLVYAGSATIAATGAPLISTIYAPNAPVVETGAAVGYYGSIISNTFTENSKAPFHYDNSLSTSAVKVGNFIPVGGFTWSKF